MLSSGPGRMLAGALHAASIAEQLDPEAAAQARLEGERAAQMERQEALAARTARWTALRNPAALLPQRGRRLAVRAGEEDLSHGGQLAVSPDTRVALPAAASEHAAEALASSPTGRDAGEHSLAGGFSKRQRHEHAAAAASDRARVQKRLHESGLLPPGIALE